MNMVELEATDDRGWRGGITRLAAHRATVTVTIEGYDRKITGQLVEVSADGDISLQQPDEHNPDTGSVMWIPHEHIISVAARYKRKQPSE